MKGAPAWPGSLPRHGVFESFDGGVRATGTTFRPDRYAVFTSPASVAGPVIARGSGLSYAAASFITDGTAIDMRSFDRILSFDATTGEVQAEAGITLSALHDFLVAQGRYLPVQPGHGQITLGGCIAADVHGKNQALDGNFSSLVTALRLFRPAEGLCDISADHQTDLFAATCGGYGLTGIIVAARLKTKPLIGNTLLMDAVAVENPAEGALLMREQAKSNDVVFSWHDFLRTTDRGIVFVGRLTEEPFPSTSRTATRIISPEWRSGLHVAIQGRAITRLMNSAYYALNRPRGRARRLTFRRALFPIEGREFYFRTFGARGFHEYQAVVPDAHFPHYIEEARRLVKKRDVLITLASGKAFDGDSRLLGFAGKGICFALNMPRNASASALLADLDRLLINVGGRPNIIKDSRLPRDVVEACFPELDEFRSLVRKWDPARVFRSELSTRLGL